MSLTIIFHPHTLSNAKGGDYTYADEEEEDDQEVDEEGDEEEVTRSFA